MARPDSDRDFYEIYTFPWQNYRPKKLVGQSISPEADKTIISLDRFKDLVRKGVPQAIEALFANEANWVKYDIAWKEIRTELFQQVRQQLPQILSTYKRTARNFHEKNDFKKNRHSFRLIHNARELQDNGYFNPSLNHPVVREITAQANLPWQERLELFKDLFFDAFKDIE